MPLLRTISHENLTLLLWQTNEDLSALSKLLGNKKVDLLNQATIQFKNLTRQKEWLSVRAALASYLGSNITVEYHKNGSPYLKGSAFHISISHTTDFVLIGLHPSYPLGVDIETFSPKVNNVLTFFTSTEENTCQSSMEKQIWYNLILWSAKESLYKAMGNKYAVNMKDNFFIPPFYLKKSGHFKAYYQYNGYRYPIMINYSCKEKFVITTCLKKSFI